MNKREKNTSIIIKHFKSRLSLIIRVNVVLNRTVVVDSDWRFDNLYGIQDYVHPDDQTMSEI